MSKITPPADTSRYDHEGVNPSPAQLRDWIMRLDNELNTLIEERGQNGAARFEQVWEAINRNRKRMEAAVEEVEKASMRRYTETSNLWGDTDRTVDELEAKAGAARIEIEGLRDYIHTHTDNRLKGHSRDLLDLDDKLTLAATRHFKLVDALEALDNRVEALETQARELASDAHNDRLRSRDRRAELGVAIREQRGEAGNLEARVERLEKSVHLETETVPIPRQALAGSKKERDRLRRVLEKQVQLHIQREDQAARQVIDLRSEVNRLRADNAGLCSLLADAVELARGNIEPRPPAQVKVLYDEAEEEEA